MARGPRFPATRSQLFTAYCDLLSVTVSRAAQVAMTPGTTAPREARRKPFGPSGWPVRRVAVALVLGLVTLGLPGHLGRLLNLRITVTDSAEPARIYRELSGVAPARGGWFAACLPATIARAGLARGYLRQGDCRAGAEPVAKLVSALPGDLVELAPSQVAINGVSIANSRTAARDSTEDHCHTWHGELIEWRPVRLAVRF